MATENIEAMVGYIRTAFTDHEQGEIIKALSKGQHEFNRMAAITEEMETMCLQNVRNIKGKAAELEKMEVKKVG